MPKTQNYFFFYFRLILLDRITYTAFVWVSGLELYGPSVTAINLLESMVLTRASLGNMYLFTIWLLVQAQACTPVLNCNMTWFVLWSFQSLVCKLAWVSWPDNGTIHWQRCNYVRCQVIGSSFLCCELLIKMITAQSLWHIIIWNRSVNQGLNQYPVVTNVHSVDEYQRSLNVLYLSRTFL